MTETRLNPTPADADAAPITQRFTWLMTALALFFTGGLFLDGWAHTHGQVDESFFTPWHAVLYAGHFISFGVLLVRWRSNSTLPPGYGWSLFGAILFLFAGIGDMLWHETLGVESGVEALLSPTHLLLSAGLFLVITGPLRAAWPNARQQLALRAQLPAVLSLTLALSVLTFFVQYASPLANTWGLGRIQTANSEQEMGLTSILLDTVMLTGAALSYMRRWRPAPGAFTIVFGLNAFAMGFLFDQGPYPLVHVLVRLAIGMFADILVRVLRPDERSAMLRLFAFLVPAGLYALYFLAAAQSNAGIAWSIHMWSGTIVLAGIAGLLVSFVSHPSE